MPVALRKEYPLSSQSPYLPGKHNNIAELAKHLVSVEQSPGLGGRDRIGDQNNPRKGPTTFSQHVP